MSPFAKNISSHNVHFCCQHYNTFTNWSVYALKLINGKGNYIFPKWIYSISNSIWPNQVLDFEYLKHLTWSVTQEVLFGARQNVRPRPDETPVINQIRFINITLPRPAYFLLLWSKSLFCSVMHWCSKLRYVNIRYEDYNLCSTNKLLRFFFFSCQYYYSTISGLHVFDTGLQSLKWTNTVIGNVLERPPQYVKSTKSTGQCSMFINK